MNIYLSIMENLAFFIIITFFIFVISMTIYFVFVRFGPYSKILRDPFEENLDSSLYIPTSTL